MPLRNRVLPTGEIVAHPGRGLFMGNRGCLHDGGGRIVRQQTSQRFWITCVLSFKGRRRALMQPGRYTELFFLDEAVALAAGHRPCAECRRADYDRFRDAWVLAHGGARPSAPAMDAALSAARHLPDGGQKTHRRPVRDLPDGVFVRTSGGAAALVLAGRFHAVDPGGYGASVPADPETDLDVLTPAPTVAVLAAGYRPVLHPSAETAAPPTTDGAGDQSDRRAFDPRRGA